jgi:hypothetical protein
MAATTKSICKTINAKNYAQLSGYCPAEAKVYRETVRRKECEGRSYTAATRDEDMRNCMNNISSDDSGTDNASPTRRKSGRNQEPESSAESNGSSTTSNELLNSVKKYKGLLGF